MSGRAPLVVVGAGAQGLTFALEAARRGERVLVVERSSAVGGQARSLRRRGFTFDFGMHAFVSRRPDLLRLARTYLGGDFRSFHPRAASWLKDGVIVEDRSWWSWRDHRQALHRLFPGSEGGPWNCMLIQEPPQVVYPRAGGFGRLFERMASALRARGGRFVFGAALGVRDFEVSGGTLRALRVGGRRIETSGCYWSAGGRALLPRRRVEESDSRLVFYHFLLKGRAPVPYHWVRIAAASPFIPPLVYYPARFSAANAPRGCYSLGAALPVIAPGRGGPAARRALSLWQGQDPAAFVPVVRRFLAEQGLIREADVIGVSHEHLPVPLDRAARAARHPLSGVRNFWDADRWLADVAGESAVPLQMASALRALDDVSPRLAGGGALRPA